jgi:hypothetical protein
MSARLLGKPNRTHSAYYTRALNLTNPRANWISELGRHTLLVIGLLSAFKPVLGKNTKLVLNPAKEKGCLFVGIFVQRANQKANNLNPPN